MAFKTAFFAFPNDPPELKVPIVAANDLILKNDSVRISAWPQLRVFGAAIPDEVKSGIEKVDVLLADITRPNLNVYYEIGYCVGLGKTLAPVLNVSFAHAVADIQKDGLFDIIGYEAYENSAQLAEIMGNMPDKVLLDLYGKPLNNQQPVFFLNGYRKTDFVNGIATAIKGSKAFYRSFDPAEDSRLSMINAIGEITSAALVIIPFLEPYIDDAPRHNVRAAFLAGLSHGLDRETLLLRYVAPDAAPAATDFREEVDTVHSPAELARKVSAFCANALQAVQSIRSPRRAQQSVSVLQRLTLGATAAENEFRTLQDYFVETSEYLRTARGEVEIVAGRKGSGKTAIFFMVRDSFRRQRNALIVDLRPESHQLTLFKGELTKILHEGAFDHTIAGFWYFVALSELLLALKRDLEFQARRHAELMREVSEIEAELKRLGISESGDFTARIDRLSGYVLAEINRLSAEGKQLTVEQMTNVVYRGGIADAKKLILKHASKFQHFVFLFDNIDKGWATDGVDELDVRMVRLLLEALEKVKRDLAVNRCDFLFAVFLRNDVFELMVSGTPDKGKASVIRIDWTDRVKLRQVIQQRLQASVTEQARNFNELWTRFFVPTVEGRDTFEYFVDHCLMRPRFLIAVVDAAISNAIDRRHDCVEEEDCKSAVEQHSGKVLNDFSYELRDVSGASEDVLNSLVGTTRFITKGEILERFEKAKIIAKGDEEKLFRYMLWYGILGVINRNNMELYIYDFDYNISRLQAEVSTQDDEPLYAFNPAIHIALKTKGPQSDPHIDGGA